MGKEVGRSKELNLSANAGAFRSPNFATPFLFFSVLIRFDIEGPDRKTPRKASLKERRINSEVKGARIDALYAQFVVQQLFVGDEASKLLSRSRRSSCVRVWAITALDIGVCRRREQSLLSLWGLEGLSRGRRHSSRHWAGVGWWSRGRNAGASGGKYHRNRLALGIRTGVTDLHWE